MAAPSVKAVYSGSVTYESSDGTSPTAISLGGTIVPGNSVVTVTARNSDNEARDKRHHFVHTLTATTIAFERHESGFAKSVTLEWQVVEFDAGVSVQRGTLDQTTETQTVGITEVVGSKSLINLAGFKTSANLGFYWHQAAREFSTNVSGDDQLTFTGGLGNPSFGQAVHEWQVIEFDQDVVIQRGVTTLVNTEKKSVAVTAVDTAKAFFTAEGVAFSDGTSADVRRNYLGEITTATNLDVSTVTDGTTANTNVAWSVVELTGGQSVQSGISAFSDTDTLNQPSFAAMTEPAVAFVSYFAPAAANTVGDVGGKQEVRCFSHSMNGSTGIDLQRNTSGYSWDVYWAAIDWATGGGGVTPISSDSTIQWNMLQAIQQDATLQNNILNALQGDSSMQWSVLNAAMSDGTLSWLINEAVLSDADARWDVLNSAFADSDQRWSLLNAAFNDADVRWDLLSALASVVSDADLRWSAFAAVQKSITAQWDTLNAVIGDSDLKWDLLTAAAAQIESRWDILNALTASSDATIQWSIIGQVENTTTLRWRIDSDSSFPDITGTITVNSTTKQITLKSITPIITIH